MFKKTIGEAGDGCELVSDQVFQYLSLPRIAPDGKRLAFGGSGDANMQPSGCGGDQRAKPAAAGPPAGARPDGLAQPAVAYAHGLPADVYSLNLDGGSLTRIADIKDDDPTVAWSPDGAKLAIFGVQALYVVDGKGGPTGQAGRPGRLRRAGLGQLSARELRPDGRDPGGGRPVSARSSTAPLLVMMAVAWRTLSSAGGWAAMRSAACSAERLRDACRRCIWAARSHTTTQTASQRAARPASISRIASSTTTGARVCARRSAMAWLTPGSRMRSRSRRRRRSLRTASPRRRRSIVPSSRSSAAPKRSAIARVSGVPAAYSAWTRRSAST